MSVTSRAGVLPKAVIATLVGTGIGVVAGVWSLRQPAASVPVSVPPEAAPAVTTRPADRDVQSPPSTSLPKQIPLQMEPTRAHANLAPAPPSSDGDAHVLERARTLARRPDVTALMALRDDVVRRSSERGVAGASSIKTELDEIDLRLNEARLLQLKLDAEELRKAR